MDNQDIHKFIGQADLSLSQAMQEIDSNGNGILFIVDDKCILTGCITDGDIRPRFFFR